MWIISSVQRELAAHWRRRRALLLAVLLLYAAGTAMTLLRVWNSAAQLDRSLMTGRLVVETVIFGCAALALLAPTLTAGLSSGAAASRAADGGYPAAAVVVAGAVLPAVATVAAAALASAVPLLLLAGAGSAAASAVLAAHVVLFAFGASVAALGALVGWALRDDHAAIALTYLVVLLLTTAPVLAGPAISRAADGGQLTRAVLLVNPFAAVAEAIDFDIARARLVYIWSPLGQRRFSYPGWHRTAGVFGLLFLLSLSLSVWQLRRRTPVSSLTGA